MIRRGRRPGQGPRWGDGRGRDRGSAVLEMVALLPIHMSFIMAVVFIGKVNNSAQNVEAAARSAARTMSIGINRNTAAAEDVARDQAADMAEEGSSFCDPMVWNAAIAVNDPPADPSTVTVTVTCTVDLSDATGLGFPGTYQVTSTSTEVVDPYREDGP